MVSSPQPPPAVERHREIAAFRAIFAQMPEAMLIADDSRRYVDANHAACGLLRLSRREILRRRIDDLSSPALRPHLDRVWQDFLRQGTVRGEWLLVRPDGSDQQVEFVARANFFPGLHLTTLRDLRRRKHADAQQARLRQQLEQRVAIRTRQLERLNQRLRAEAAQQREIAGALRQSERRYRALFNRANDAILIIDPATLAILQANARARKLYGFGRRPLKEIDFSRFLADPALERRFFRETMEGQGPRAFVSQRFHRDGSPIIVEVHIAAVGYNGGQAVLSIGRDVTAQRRAEAVIQASEQRLRAAMEASLDAVYMLAAVRNRRGRIVDFRFTETNARGLAFVGATRRQLLGGLLCELMPVNRTSGFFERYVRVVETGQPLEETFQLEPPWRRTKWSKPKWLHHQVVRLGDGILIVTRDVTTRQQTEEALRAWPHQLTQAQEAERRRVARELHDGVNQMLVSVHLALRHSEELAPSESALRTKLVARAIRTVGQALGEVRRISHALRPSALDDLGLSAALSGLLRDFTERTGIEVAWRNPRLAREIPSAAAEALYRIAQEALTNVERHAHAQKVSVRLVIRRGRVLLTVRDDGRGFILPPNGRGAGYGLLHMRERAEFAGGAFRMLTRPGRGASIEASLPVVS